MSIKVGCCGFPLAKEKYYQHFSAVELQQTFYQPPQLKTAKRWREEAPTKLEFTLKAWQLITHTPTSPTYRRLKVTIPPRRQKYLGSFQPTEEVFAAWEKIDETAKALHAQLIIFQCPASFDPTNAHKENLRKFFTTVERNRYLFVWEPRGTWQLEEVYELCRELQLTPCLDPFLIHQPPRPLGYFRLHGKESYRYRYQKEDLICFKRLSQHFTHTYFMFNNISMYDDAKHFLKLLGNG